MTVENTKKLAMTMLRNKNYRNAFSFFTLLICI